jgi:hypothetical protein
MNKKELGSSLRRGVVAGTIAGSFSGWAAFAGHTAIAPAPSVPEPAPAAPALPPLPAAPSLAPLPNVRVADMPNTVVLPPIRVTAAAPVTATRKS